MSMTKLIFHGILAAQRMVLSWNSSLHIRTYVMEVGINSQQISYVHSVKNYLAVENGMNHTPPQPFYGPFSETTRVSQCQKRTSGLYGARED